MLAVLVTAISTVGSFAFASEGESAARNDTGRKPTLTLVVMDPLSLPLSCPCVEGYAQRKYEVLQAYLQRKLACHVELVFNDSLQSALEKTEGRADIVIGKDSVVRADAQAAGLPMHAVARLTDKSGKTSQHGLIVVNKLDPAKQVADLEGYKIIFGPAEAAEKHTAAKMLLAAAGVSVPEELTIDEACSDGACKVIDLGPKSKSAAVISSYAQPLLEGCGTIKKGDLRVVGQTEPVPFITAFVSDKLDASVQTEITSTLESVVEEPDLLVALESLMGFMSISDEPKKDQAASSEQKKKIR
jgi:ABC-type phosphate/phosphonate transport system substrate-binding protein